MTINIKNVYCVGRNYIQHAKELNNPVPKSPLLFTKPTHALVVANGQDIILPGDQGRVHYEVEFVVHIARTYEQGISIDELVDYMSIGIDFTLRDVQTDLKEKAYPWLLAKGFVNAAVITPWQPFPGMRASMEKEFSLDRNGQKVQRGNIRDMVFDLPTLLDYTAKHLGLGKGDIFFTGTPAGVGTVVDEDLLTLKWGEKNLGSCKIILSPKGTLD